MKRMSKVGVAAAIAAAVILGLTFVRTSHDGRGAAWAIEQTVAALEGVHSVYMAGLNFDIDQTAPGMSQGHVKPRVVELWARPDEDREHVRDGLLVISGIDGTRIIMLQRDDTYYTYHSGQNTVHIVHDLPPERRMFDPWPGPNYFRKFKEFAGEWQEFYRRDEITGRDCVFVKASSATTSMDSRSWWFQFDLETKLPLAAKQWENRNHEGVPSMVSERLVYNLELADDLFEFETPEDAKVIDTRQAERKND